MSLYLMSHGCMRLLAYLHFPLSDSVRCILGHVWASDSLDDSIVGGFFSFFVFFL